MKIKLIVMASAGMVLTLDHLALLRPLLVGASIIAATVAGASLLWSVPGIRKNVKLRGRQFYRRARKILPLKADPRDNLMKV